MIGIYKITSPTGRVYIGQSIDIANRFKDYKRKPCTSQMRLNRSFIKHGISSHIFEVLVECEIAELNEKERYYQDLYDVLAKGLNCRLTFTNDKSGKVSDESRLNMSLSKKGGRGSLGRILSEESKNIMRIKATGRKHTAEAKSKVSKSLLGNARRQGVKHTEEVKRLMSLSRKGKPQCEKAVEARAKQRRKLILDLEMGIFYAGVKEASTAKNVKESTLKARINSKSYNSTLIYA